jgi:hypothetical protein
MEEKPLSAEELQAIRRRCEAAFMEPLAAVRLGPDSVGLVYSSESARGSKAMPLAKYYGPHKIANARFAAQAKQDMQRLLAEIQRLKSLLKKHDVPTVPHGASMGSSSDR